MVNDFEEQVNQAIAEGWKSFGSVATATMFGEIGLTSSRQPMELSVSAVLPMSRYAMSERYSYYRNRVLLGEATASYSTMTFSINIRAGLTLFKSKHRPVFNQPKPPKPIQSNSRFDRLPLKEPSRLAVFFDLEKATLSSTSFPELNELSQWLMDNPNVEIRLEGHTDLIGDASENRHLSILRVEMVKNYLISKGVIAHRIDTKGFGESRPLNRDCSPPDYCPENRRVDMIIRKR